ncbi:MAG: hypothetical protein L6R39_004141, partial [Caloplaca ligustica]
MTNATDTTAARAGPRVIYFLSNDAAGNSIVAMKVGADGTLSEGSTTPTGGKGASGLLPNTNRTAGPDSLSSQSAVYVKGNMMVAVNAGSNTMTMMAIDAADPTKLTMVGKPVDTMGEFPVTAVLSLKNKMACVGNTGAQAGIACFAADPKTGLKPLMRSQIPFPSLQQSTPPVGPTNTVSQVLFNADESALLTTVKGEPTRNTTGFLSILPVHNGCPAARDIRSSPAGTAVLFGFALIPGTTDLFVTDAAFGTVTLSTSGAAPAVLQRTTIPGQRATCWTAISPLTNTAFVTDPALNRIVEVDTKSGEILQITNLNNGNAGNTDMVAGGKMVYVLSAGNET